MTGRPRMSARVAMAPLRACPARFSLHSVRPDIGAQREDLAGAVGRDHLDAEHRGRGAAEQAGTLRDAAMRPQLAPVLLGQRIAAELSMVIDEDAPVAGGGRRAHGRRRASCARAPCRCAESSAMTWAKDVATKIRPLS